MREFAELVGKRVRVDFPDSAKNLYNQQFHKIELVGGNTMLLIGIAWYNLAYIESINEQH